MFTVYIESDNGHVEVLGHCTNRRVASDLAKTVHGSNHTAYVVKD